MLFGAFPIVYQELRGWSEGVGGLAFLGVAVGMITGVIYSIIDNKRYERIEREHGGEAPPEARLPPAMVGAVALPIGMFWFAWTNGPSIHWIVSIIATAPFGFGMVIVFLDCMNYLIDSCKHSPSFSRLLVLLRSIASPYTNQWHRHHLRSFRPGRKFRPPFALRRRLPPLHHTDVLRSRGALGQQHPRLPRVSLPPFPVRVLQIRRENQNEVQVREAGARGHGADEAG